MKHLSIAICVVALLSASKELFKTQHEAWAGVFGSIAFIVVLRLIQRERASYNEAKKQRD